MAHPSGDSDTAAAVPNFEADPAAAGEDEAFWDRVDAVFDELEGLPGEVDRNMFFCKDAADPAVKLVLQVTGSVRTAARTVLAYLADEPDVIDGAKLLINRGVLLIVYVSANVEDSLKDVFCSLADDLEAAPFLPLNAAGAEPRRVWIGAALEYGALCRPFL